MRRASSGRDRLGSLHLNDSQTPLGSNRDRHANIGEGELGAHGLRARSSRRPAFDGLPCVLETPGEDREGPSREEVALGAMELRERGIPAARPARQRAGRSRQRRQGAATPGGATGTLLELGAQRRASAARG